MLYAVDDIKHHYKSNQFNLEHEREVNLVPVRKGYLAYGRKDFLPSELKAIELKNLEEIKQPDDETLCKVNVLGISRLPSGDLAVRLARRASCPALEQHLPVDKIFDVGIQARIKDLKEWAKQEDEEEQHMRSLTAWFNEVTSKWN